MCAFIHLRICCLSLLHIHSFKMNKKKTNARRYYIHSKCKKHFRVDSRNRYVFMNKLSPPLLPPKIQKMYKELLKYGYKLQTKIDL